MSSRKDPRGYNSVSTSTSSPCSFGTSDSSANLDFISSSCSDRCPFIKPTNDNALLVDSAVEKEDSGITKTFSLVEKEIIRVTEDLAKLRGPAKSICPSEVARKVFPSSCWRCHMSLVRQIGFSLAERGTIVVSQRNQIILPANFHNIRGPIRFKIQQKE